jgi:hypothetical protein
MKRYLHLGATSAYAGLTELARLVEKFKKIYI